MKLWASTTDLAKFVFDRIARVFNRSKAIQAAALDVFKTFDRGCHAGFLHKLKYGILDQVFGLI